MKNMQHKNYCLLASVQNHSAMSMHEVTVQILHRKQMRFRSLGLLSFFMSLEKSLNGLSSLQAQITDSCYSIQTSAAGQRVTALINSTGATHSDEFNELFKLQILQF